MTSSLRQEPSSTPPNATFLADLLRPIRLEGVFYSRWFAHAPWNVIGEAEPLALMHYVRKGACTVSLDDGTAPVVLRPGELAVFPHGTVHDLGDTPGGPGVPLDQLLLSRAPGTVEDVYIDGPGEETQFLCGALRYDLLSTAPLYRALPPIMVLSQDAVRADPLLDSMLRHLAGDTVAHGLGGDLAVLRAFETVFVLALRAALSDSGDRRAPLLGLRDERILRALHAMHCRYDRPWTVASLAEHVGMSRSAFAETFRDAVGEAPMTHLLNRRVQEAQRLLTATELPVAAVARRVGYGSTAGFHMAFSQCVGQTPGQFRVQTTDDHHRPDPGELGLGSPARGDRH